MMLKKRGVLVVVVVFLLLLFSANVLAEKFISVGWRGDDYGIPNGGAIEPSEDVCDENREEWLPPEYFAPPGADAKVIGDGACYLSAVTRFRFPPSQEMTGEKGCWFLVVEDDDASDSDDGGWAIIRFGQIFDSFQKSVPDKRVSGDEEHDWMDPAGCGAQNDAQDCLLNYAYKSNTALLCSDDEYWHGCGPEDIGEAAWADGKLYQCTSSETGTTWKLIGQDKDKDGYIKSELGPSEDCVDEPFDPISPNKPGTIEVGLGIECPTLTDDDIIGKTLSDVRQAARAACEENPGKFSRCAICINNGAAEVCGDKINNDCGGPGQKEEYTTSSGATPDNCHLNQASCEQQFVGLCSESGKACTQSGDQCEEDEQCLFDVGGICKPSNAETCKTAKDCGNPSEYKCNKNGEEGVCEYIAIEYCSEDSVCGDPEAWHCDKSSVTAKNIYNEEFDWIETTEGGYCCGYEGAKDAGKIEENLNKESHACLTKNKDFVNTEKDFEGVDLDKIFELNCDEGKNWCWLKAATANAIFKVFTIKRPGEVPFDVVSNGDDWSMCSDQVDKTIKAPAIAPEGSEPDVISEGSHRFYCYYEGNRWSWAECTEDWSKRENPSIKGRYTGEGLYTLPLSLVAEVPEEVSQEDNPPYIRDTLSGNEIQINYKNLYNKYYGQGFLDFTGYNYLNFMVHFVKDEAGTPAELKDLQFPLGINLILLGPKLDEGPVAYDKHVAFFDGEVLGYVINTPFADPDGDGVMDKFMHVQVPIKDYKAIESIKLKASKENKIEVRNIYLTSDNSELPNQLCSGDSSTTYNSWFADADAGNAEEGVTGENLCEVLYGEEAWLGEDQEVSEIKPAANCCGNAKNEYYSGLSKGVVSPEEGSEATYYGCWNSQPIASGNTIMDVEFEVTSKQKKFDVAYQPIELPSIDMGYRVYSDDEKDNLKPKTGSLKCNELPKTMEVGKTSVALCSFTISEDFKSKLPLEYRGLTKLWFNDPLSDTDSPVELFFFDQATATKADDTIGELIKSGSLKTDEYDSEFKITGPIQYLNKEKVLDIWNHPISVVAKLKPNHFFPISNLAPSTKPVTQTVTYACSETECLFPLPGNPPYKVTNLHPDLYELYYVTGKLAADETPVTSQEFKEYANLRVKRIAQQVLYYNEGEESTKEIGFYGCRAADFITNIEEGKNLQYCAVIGDKFCSYSEVHKEEKNKDAFTVVNTWSEEGLTHVGYADPLQKPEPGQNISAYYENVELVLKEQAKSASTRNQSTAVLPARNFIPNAEFATLGAGQKLPYWEVYLGGNPVANEKGTSAGDYQLEIGSNKFILGNNNVKLRSERISVPSSVDLYFSTAQECTTKILLVDKDGNSEEATLPQFNTGDASYLVVEFTGPCEVEKPMLQVIDEFGPVEFAYQSYPELSNPDARSGAACCPNNYCWNGYACVEPMSALTTITEHVADGRDYRCVDGAWKRSPLKFDWNAQQWGFCPQESQCFVLGSGKTENTAESFYKGEYPICVNNTEYIFDNYCNQGNWTSRTKYLATKLLEVAENDEYTLYCSPYRETLLDLGNNENYLGGEYLVTQKAQQSLSQSLQKPAQPQALPTCFNSIKDPDGKRLVPDSQNTCINNVCVLQYKDDGKFKVALATTLNKEIDDPKSFLISLNIPQDKLSQVCKGSGSDFVECNLQGLEFPSSADLYHSDELNAVIFAQEGLKLSPGVIDNILKWFKNLFGSGPLAEKTFVTRAQNFRNVYIANIAGKKVRAVEEIFPGVRQSLVAEYQNFDTPVCEYVKNIKVPPELQLELLEEASGMEKVHCAVDGTTQRVVVNAGLDFFWPQLTGKLRIS